MKKTLIVVFIACELLILHSCWSVQQVPRKYVDKFDKCFDGVDNNYDSIIDLNGYYEAIVLNTKPYTFWDGVPHYTSKTVMMFFEDGTCVYGIGGFNTGEKDELFFDENVANPKRQESFSNSYYWGLYRINHDTLSMTCINHISFGYPPWVLINFTYLIQDKKTIKCIKEKRFLTDYSFDKVKSYETNYNDFYASGEDTIFYYPAHFVPLKSLPSSDCWLKKNRWFWCDEEKYTEYMLRNKER